MIKKLSFFSQTKSENIFLICLSLIIKGVEYIGNLHKQGHCNKVVL
jgi:hypothetical protein